MLTRAPGEYQRPQTSWAIMDSRNHDPQQPGAIVFDGRTHNKRNDLDSAWRVLDDMMRLREYMYM